VIGGSRSNGRMHCLPVGGHRPVSGLRLLPVALSHGEYAHTTQAADDAEREIPDRWPKREANIEAEENQSETGKKPELGYFFVKG